MQRVRLKKTTHWERLGLWGRFLALAFCAAASLSAASGAFAQGDDPAAAHKAAADLLNRIHEAALQQNYEGTFVYQRGATVESSHITHAAARGDGEYESLESLDGKPRTMLRHDDDMYTFVPERHLVVVNSITKVDAKAFHLTKLTPEAHALVSHRVRQRWQRKG